MKIVYINSENEYEIRFHSKIEDKKSISFSKKSVRFHKRFYSFETHPVMAIEDNGEITAVLFYNLTKHNLSIINILCPEKYRKRGYSKELIKEAYRQAYSLGKDHVRCNCEITALPFYDKLNFIYAGRNKDKHTLFAYFPLISADFQDYISLKNKEIGEIYSQKEIESLLKKVKDSSEGFFIDSPGYLYENIRNAGSKF